MVRSLTELWFWEEHSQEIQFGAKETLRLWGLELQRDWIIECLGNTEGSPLELSH